MLAALELEHASTRATLPLLGRVQTILFGTPRVGDATFARHFSATFWRDDDHWAIRAANDAIPHLPFMSWGFRHPKGGLQLEQVRAAPGAPPTTTRHVSDPGDSIELLRPREGNVENWVTCHDLNEYVDLLTRLRSPEKYRKCGPRAEVLVDGLLAGGRLAEEQADGAAKAAEWGEWGI